MEFSDFVKKRKLSESDAPANVTGDAVANSDTPLLKKPLKRKDCDDGKKKSNS